jgi:hypothetical protein
MREADTERVFEALLEAGTADPLSRRAATV